MQKPKKSKKPKFTISQSRSFDKNKFGDEPEVPLSEPTEFELLKILNWYSYMLTREDSFEFLCKHFENSGALLKKIKSINPEYFDISIGWLCRLIARGAQISSKLEKIEKHVNMIIDKYYVEKKRVVRENTLDKKSSKEDIIIGDIEELVDKQEGIYQYLVANSIPKTYIPTVIKYYEPILNELTEALSTKDVDLKEGYNHLYKPELRKLIEFYQSVINDLSRYGINEKKERKPRKKKAVNLDKKLKNVNYMERFDELKLVSKKPEAILNAKEVWLYDTKYKKIHRYIALDGGLDIKGTTIINFDPTQSQMKLTGRKTQEIVSRVLSEGKLGLRKIMDTIKNGSQTPTGRINSYTIILKAVT